MDWKTLPHGPLEQLAENLWYVQGDLPGMSLKRVMTVAQRADTSLVIHSAIAMNESDMRKLESIGEPRYLIVPSKWHRLDAAAYKERYPSIKVYAPSTARPEVEKLVALDGVLEDYPQDPAVNVHPLDGVGGNEGVMLVHSNDGATVVLCDAVFNMDTKRDVVGWLFTTILGSAPGPRVSRLAKWLIVKDKAALRAELERFAAMPDLVRLIVAHEKVTRGKDETQAALLKAASYLR